MCVIGGHHYSLLRHFMSHVDLGTCLSYHMGGDQGGQSGKATIWGTTHTNGIIEFYIFK